MKPAIIKQLRDAARYILTRGDGSHSSIIAHQRIMRLAKSGR